MLYIRKYDTIGDNAVNHKRAVELLYFAVKKEYGIAISEKDIATNEHGKPYLKNYSHIHYSYSHTANIIALVVDDKPCGCDIELTNRKVSDSVIKRCYSKLEIDSALGDDYFISLWTLKEAYIKAVGTGFSYGMTKAEFKKENSSIALLDKTTASYRFNQIKLFDSIISICQSE